VPASHPAFHIRFPHHAFLLACAFKWYSVVWRHSNVTPFLVIFLRTISYFLTFETFVIWILKSSGILSRVDWQALIVILATDVSKTPRFFEIVVATYQSTQHNIPKRLETSAKPLWEPRKTHFLYLHPLTARSFLSMYTETPFVSCYPLSSSGSKRPASINVQTIRVWYIIEKIYSAYCGQHISDAQYMYFSTHVTINLDEYIACTHVFSIIISELFNDALWVALVIYLYNRILP